MNKETNRASQNAYHEAREFGHTKEDSRVIRDNWKSSKNTYDDSPEPTYGWSDSYETRAYHAETELNRKYYESLDPSHSDYRDLD
jgi:hypothetical protein